MKLASKPWINVLNGALPMIARQNATLTTYALLMKHRIERRLVTPVAGQ
jgi:hypothetical protein